jgi:hypothetical protein
MEAGKMRKPLNLVFIYIYLAVSCAMVGMGLVFALILACEYFNIDISEHWWLITLPVTLAILLNITLIELYRRYKMR